MNIKLEIILPKITYRNPASGVYILEFDNGMFYIGSSCNLWRRAQTWKRALSKEKPDVRMIWQSVIDKIRNCESATFKALELIPILELTKIEGDLLMLYKDNNLLINKILHPKNGIIVKNNLGIEVNRYPSLKQAAKQMGIFPRQIQDVCNGLKKTCRGFKFEYEDGRPIKYPKTCKMPTIYKYKDGIFVKKYFSYKEAASDTGVDRKGVYNVIKGIQKTTGGCVFKIAIQHLWQKHL